VQPTCERKLIGTDKDSIETIETNDSAELEPVIDVAVSPEEINQLEVEVPRSELPKQETQPTKAEYASKNLPSVSFDNPKRKPGSLAKSSNSQLEIISYQFNYKSQPSSRLPSVSKILQATMSPEQAQILEKWQQKMIAQLGEDGFKKYKDALFSNGKELHKNLQLVLGGTPREYLTIDDAIFGHWNSLQTLLPQVKDVHVLESMVSHPQLGYCGIVDCVALYRDKLVLIDWKTSEKKKSFVSMTYDTPLQISAYIGALNHDPKYSFKVTSGLIVIAYQDGSCCQHFNLSPADLNKYWNEWLRRLNLYKKISGTSTAA
jgi:genome maintenance exonuclease 1